jgi:hypothetical protein
MVSCAMGEKLQLTKQSKTQIFWPKKDVQNKEWNFTMGDHDLTVKCCMMEDVRNIHKVFMKKPL